VSHNLTLCLGRYTLAGKMSVIERIKQIQQAQTDRAAQTKLVLETLEEKERLAREKVETPKMEVAEKRRESINKILVESGVLESFTNIKDNLLEEGVDSEKPETSYVSSGVFVKGPENTHFKKIEINYEKGDLKLLWGSTAGVMDWGYFFIQASVNPNDETLVIGGRVLRRDEWTKRDLIETAIAEAYLSPDTKRRSHDSGGWGIEGGIGGVN
jgi:hypothetical protein